MIALRFCVKSWASANGEKPDISFLPAMMRRRLSQTARLALRAAHDCLDGQGHSNDAKGLRSVFCSRYGEYEKTLPIVGQILSGEGASPAAFSHSVFNLPSGLHAIATSNKAPSTVISAGASTLEAGMMEAALQMVESSEDVLVVYVDAPLPDIYVKEHSKDEAALAVALVIGPEDDGTDALILDLSWSANETLTPPPVGMPESSKGLLGLLAGKGEGFSITDGRLTWVWEKVSESGKE